MRVFMLVPFVEWVGEWMNEQTHRERISWYAFLVLTVWSTHYTEGVFLTKVCGKKQVRVGVPSECSVRVPFKEVAVRNLPFVLSVLLAFLFLMLRFCFMLWLLSLECKFLFCEVLLSHPSGERRELQCPVYTPGMKKTFLATEGCVYLHDTTLKSAPVLKRKEIL